MDNSLVEQLLYNDESEWLDFKSKQYPFEKSGDIEKAELLKDLLAFANSWRRTEGYILIGVPEERREGRKVVPNPEIEIPPCSLGRLSA